MGWKSPGVVRFELRPLLQGQTRRAKLKVLITRLLLVVQVWDVNQLIGNHGLEISRCGQI